MNLLTPRIPQPTGACFVALWRPLAAEHCAGSFKKTNIFSSFIVDKLQFEPPLRKETEAHSEMVIGKSLILHHFSIFTSFLTEGYMN